MKYPLVRQDGLKNCGPCSLASIIMYYGGYVSVDALEDMMSTTKNGTTAYNLVQAARKIGFESSGIKIENIDDINYPCIAHVTLSNVYNHFVVIYKVDDKVLVGDPASKLKYMTKDDFNKIWNRVIITLKPVKEMPYNKPKTLFSYIKKYISNYKFESMLLIIVSIISSILSLLYSLLVKYIIDNFIMIKDIL